MHRKSSFDPSPPPSTRPSHNFEHFPIFGPIRDGKRLSQRLSQAGIDVNKYHVQAVRVAPQGEGIVSGQQQIIAGHGSVSSSRSNSGSIKSTSGVSRKMSLQLAKQQPLYDNWGPRFSQVTLSSRDEPMLTVTDVYRNPIVSSSAVTHQLHFPAQNPMTQSVTVTAGVRSRKSSIEDTTDEIEDSDQVVDSRQHHNEHPANHHRDNDSDVSNEDPRTYRRDSLSRRRPSSVEDEMNNGRGFKSWSRSHTSGTGLYNKNPRTGTPHIFDKQSVKVNRGADPGMADRAVKLQYHMRRPSGVTGNNSMPPSCLKHRRASIMTTIFGESGSRRFSEDLRATMKPTIDPSDEDSEGYHISIESETAKVIFFQVFIPFLIAGFGNVAAGLILDFTQHWTVFRETPELFVLIASFIGFKGNLEMTLAARLSTITNMGEMDNRKAQVKVTIGNVCLVQGQAIVLAFLAAVIAIAISYFKELVFEPQSWLLILTTSLVTASFTGFMLPVLTVCVTIMSRKVGINPDNVSTLTTAFLGDLSAVVMLCYSARFFFHYRPMVWLEPCTIAFYIVLLPICLYVAYHNEYTREVVGSGWVPIIIAMVISSFAGLIFDFSVQKYQTIAVFQPIINGVGSNLVAVHASRISTYLHLRCKLGSLPVDEDGVTYEMCQSPWSAFFGNNPNAKTARLLLLMSIPGHIIYVVTIRLVRSGSVFITFAFLTTYLFVSITQVIVLLYMAHVIVPLLWSRMIDPDNAAIPGIMSCGDLLGTAFLTASFAFLNAVYDPNATDHMHETIIA